MYARTVQGQVLTFFPSGTLERRVLVLADRETGTRWSQLTGGAISGPLIGQHLSLLATQFMTWNSWRQVHPASSLFSRSLATSFTYQGAKYGLGGGAAGHSQMVVGTRVGTAVRGYPFDVLDRSPILNDDLGGVSIVIAYDAAQGFGLVWDRQIGGQVLQFTAGPKPLTAIDQRGDSWDLLLGQALSGPLAGQHLEERWATAAYAQGWSYFFGRGSLYGG